MKVLIRAMGLLLIGVICLVTMINLINMNIQANELNCCTALSIEQTQDKIITYKSKKDEELNLYDDDYKNYFIDYFNDSVNDSDHYDLDISTDLEHGILSGTIVSNRYDNIRPKQFVNIIDFSLGYQKAKDWGECNQSNMAYKKEVESKTTEKYSLKKNTAWTTYLKNNVWPQTLYEESFTQKKTLKSYSIQIYVYQDTAVDLTKSYWYPALKLSIKDKDGNWIQVASKGENSYSGTKILSGTYDNDVYGIKLEMTAYKPTNGYISKLNRIGTKSTTFNYEIYSKTVACPISWSDEIVDEKIEGETYKEVYYNYRYRYIDDLNTLSAKSIFKNNEEYNNALSEHLKIYEKTN